jgi:chromosome segregation protein
LDHENLIGQQSRADEELITLNADYAANLERIEALKSYRAKRSEEMGVLDERRDEFIQKANEISIKIAGCEKDVENVDQMLATIGARIDDLKTERQGQNDRIDELAAKRDGIGSKKSENAIEYEKLEKEIENLRQKRTEVESGNDEFERELANIRVKVKEKTASRQVTYENVVKNENRLLQLEERQDKLGSQLWDDYEITYEDAVALQYPPVTAENRDEVAATQASCRAKLRAIGSYNPGAIDEYAEVKTQFDALNTQYVDLTSSYDELTNIIARLEDEMRTSFITAFEAINRNFGKTFKDLFGGGSAELSMTDPEDVLTSGIEIKAAPPGKIIKSMSLLSGGEQSFVAIALLFAILKVNPTPFCILDEIEAALDDTNVVKYAQYLHRLTDKTQFIAITHRRGTMEEADMLYGVTMQDKGISRLLAMTGEEVEQMKLE